MAEETTAALPPAPSITRQEYMARSGQAFRKELGATTPDDVHREYYSQFVTEDTRRAVVQRFGEDVLARAFQADRSFNSGRSTAIAHWDRLCFTSTGNRPESGPFMALLPFDTALKRRLDDYGTTRADLVCIAKEAAKQVAEVTIAAATSASAGTDGAASEEEGGAPL